MILVTAAGGNVGRELIGSLAARGVPFRAGYHSPAKAEAARASGQEATVLDFEEPASIRAAMDRVDRLFLATPATPDQPRREEAMVEEARRAGVRRIVKLSVWRAPEESYTFARWNRVAEKRVQASGIPHTLLRPNGFMQNLTRFSSESIRARGVFRLPDGAARISHVDARDVASVAAVALTEEGHEGRAYDLSGPEALTYPQIAAILSRVLGRPISFESISAAEFTRSMLQLGSPEWMPASILDLTQYALQGQASDVLGSIPQILGRKPIAFDRFARDHREAFA
jgi:uncharacterized protein YbjT (DUF2867 family)